MAAIQRVRRYIAIWLICWCAAWAANLPSAMAESPDWLTASPRPSASTGLDDTPASVDLETPPSLFTFSSPVVLTSFNQNEVENENENDEEGPEHIRDNAFLVEEAFNQEAGEVQHIFNWIDLRSRSAEPKARDFAWTYTMEIPLGSQKHQFSFTSLMLDAYEKPAGGPATRTGGVGDTLLNYRYQLLADDDFLWCAPRITLIVPTGDERFGLGNGEAGYQFNLPISSYGEMFDYHANAGFTYYPSVSLPMLNGFDSPHRNLRGYNFGASAFWKPEVYLNFFVEALVFANDEIDDAGFRVSSTQALLNPGLRYAVCQFDEVEWVLGVSVPIGLTSDSPDIGAFFYMSVEHIFRKVSDAPG